MPVFSSTGEAAGTFDVYREKAFAPRSNERELIEVASYLSGLAVERARSEDGPRQKLLLLVRHLGEGVIAIDEGGKVVEINPAARGLMGIDQTATILSYRDLPAPLSEMLHRVCRAESMQAEQKTIRVHATEILAYVSPVTTKLGWYGCIALLQDITAQTKFRRLEENLVANVSHELLGPITTVSAIAEELRDEIVQGEDRQTYIKTIINDLGHVHQVLKDVVDLSRLDSGLLPLDPPLPGSWARTACRRPGLEFTSDGGQQSGGPNSRKPSG